MGRGRVGEYRVVQCPEADEVKMEAALEAQIRNRCVRIGVWVGRRRIGMGGWGGAMQKPDAVELKGEAAVKAQMKSSWVREGVGVRMGRQGKVGGEDGGRIR